MTDMLFISQVPAYLLLKYGVRRTRRAVSYWINEGRLVNDKRVYLMTRETQSDPCQLYTRKPWVDKFIDKMSRRNTA